MGDVVMAIAPNREEASTKIFVGLELFFAEILINGVADVVLLWVSEDWPVWVKHKRMLFIWSWLFLIVSVKPLG